MSHKIYLCKSLLIILFTINLIFLCSTGIYADDPDTIHPQIQIRRAANLTTSSITQDFASSFTTIIGPKEKNVYTIRLNGLTTDVAPLPENSTIIQLPENRFVYRSPTLTTSLLPEGTELTYHDDSPILIVPGEAIVLEATNMESYPVEKLPQTTSYDQTINKLDTYSLTIILSELNNPTFSTYTTSYTISWGDGTTTTHTPDKRTHTHIYQEPGTYTLIINVTDAFGYSYIFTQPYTIAYEGHLLHTYLLLEEHKEPMALATTTTISGFTLVFIAITETGKYKLLVLLPLLIPLYTRITKEDVLDQFVRGQIFGYIKTNPGVHYNQLRREIGIKNGTLSYHLRVLEKTEIIKSRREGLRYRAFYPTGMNFPKNERFRLTELQIAILNHIRRNPGITQREIARTLKRKPQTINYNIKVLDQANLINVHHSGRKTGLYALDTDADIQLIGQ